ncbi:TRAP transporter small permease subunit [Chachezhania antarctica]|uniref:TRAP transporter small permease subunit n=1 Tax=Chachezhania antarctica TaxID=2340860 RepID=UPI001968DCD1|nr:TRAP transporter small permease subunit [Chachezhania antarctica]
MTLNSEPNAPDTGRSRHPLVRAWSWIVEGLAALGTVLIAVLMLIICADIVARNTMGASLPLISELGALTLVMIVYLQLAATIRANRLARTEIWLPGFCERHPRAGAVLTGLFDLTAAALLGLIAWSSLRIIGKDYDAGEYIGVTGIATLVVWPFRVMILIGVAAAALEALFRTIAAFRSAARGRPA